MSSEDTLIATRVDKHSQLNGGAYPLAKKGCPIKDVLAYVEIFPPTESLDPAILVEDKINKRFPALVVHGRITNLRKSGGITFIKIADSSGSMQMIATKAVLTDYDKLPLLDLGDIIEVSGLVCV